MKADAAQGRSGGPKGRGREVLLAAAVYAVVLLPAVSSDYLRGRGLYNGVIWDPIPLYLFAPADQVGSRALHEGYFPIWDPTRGLGDSHAHPSGGMFDQPFKLLVYIFNTRLNWELYLAGRLFLAGLFCFIAARHLGLWFKGALFAGMSYMLCGFFREFHNFQELDMEALAPLFIMFLLLLARRPRLLFFAAPIVLGQFLDTQPVSFFFLYVFAALLYLITGAAAAGRSHEVLKAGAGRVLILGAVMTCALLAAGDYVLLITEFFVHGWTYHPGNMGDLRVPLRSAIALCTPLFDYWIKSEPNLALPHLEQLTLTPAYFGVVTSVLALAAILRPRRLPATGLAFVAAALGVAGIVFGVPPFNLALKLPLIRYFQTFRYAQPFLALCMAMLAGLGLDRLSRGRDARRAALAIAAVIGVWIAAHLFIFRREALGTPYVLFGLAVAAAGGAVIVAAAVAAWKSGRADAGRAAAWGLIALNGFELALYFNLAAPLYGPAAFDVSRPPAAEFIRKRHDAGPFRVFGADQRLLHPNLAGVYGLSDLRDTTPLFPRDYADLMAAINGWRGEEVIENYLADGKFYFDLDFTRIPPRMLDLLNVRYILSYGDPLARPALELQRDVKEITATAPDYAVPADLSIGGVTRPGLLLHAPARVRAGAGPDIRGRVSLDAGILGRARDCGATDGVGLVLLAGPEGRERLLFARNVNADRDRSWIPAEFDADGGALVFAALPGPRDDRRCDFGAWSRPELEPERGEGGTGFHLEKIYAREMRVYENRSVLPRAFPVQDLARAETLTEFVSGVRAGDPARTAWLMERGGPPRDTFSPAAIADIVEGFGRLTFTAEASGPAFAVVSDLDYPGFRARVNGKETRIWKVDGALMGLELPPGASRVEIVYAPWSFRTALWCRIVVVIAAVLALLALLKKRAARAAGAG